MLYIVGWNIVSIHNYIPDILSIGFIVCGVANDNTHKK